MELSSTDTPSVSTDLHPSYFARTFNFIRGISIQGRAEDRKNRTEVLKHGYN